MNTLERELHVISRLNHNILTSRESGEEWADVLSAYRRYLESRRDEKSA